MQEHKASVVHKPSTKVTRWQLTTKARQSRSTGLITMDVKALKIDGGYRVRSKTIFKAELGVRDTPLTLAERFLIERTAVALALQHNWPTDRGWVWEATLEHNSTGFDETHLDLNEANELNLRLQEYHNSIIGGV